MPRDWDNPVPNAPGVIGPTILLHGGSYFSFTEPESSHYTIDDIAHGLSLACRFAGQCREFYSVAQHSVYASRFVQVGIRMTALLHDGSEAFTGDMAKPLKLLQPEFKRIEDRIQNDIYNRFCGSPAPKQFDNLKHGEMRSRLEREAACPDNIRRDIKAVDLCLLKTEQEQLMGNHDEWGMLTDVHSLSLTIKPWSPKKAKRKFLERYEELKAFEENRR